MKLDLKRRWMLQQGSHVPVAAMFPLHQGAGSKIKVVAILQSRQNQKCHTCIQKSVVSSAVLHSSIEMERYSSFPVISSFGYITISKTLPPFIIILPLDKYTTLKAAIKAAHYRHLSLLRGK